MDTYVKESSLDLPKRMFYPAPTFVEGPPVPFSSVRPVVSPVSLSAVTTPTLPFVPSQGWSGVPCLESRREESGYARNVSDPSKFVCDYRSGVDSVTLVLETLTLSSSS